MAEVIDAFDVNVHSENLGSISIVAVCTDDDVTKGQAAGALLSALATIINEIESPEERSQQVSLAWAFFMEQCIYKEDEK